MRSSNARLATAITVAMFVVFGCASAANPTPVVTFDPANAPIPTSPPATSAPPAPVATPTPTPATTVIPTASADATPRVVELTAILAVAEADRFETYGGESIRLEHVWSPTMDLGLGGTCGPSSVPWLECLGVPDWLIQPASDDAGYDGGRLGILYEPGLGERLALGEGPVDVIGHFGDPASKDCRPKDRAACRDRFVVTGIEKAGS